MKKLFYSLSLAMAFGVAANAAAPTAEMQRALPAQLDIQAAQMSASAMTWDRIDPVDGKKQVRKERANSAEDYLGNYEWSGTNMLSGVVFPNQGYLSITVNPENPKQLLIDGLTSVYTLYAEYDEATGYLVVPDQDLGFNSYYNDMMVFTNWTYQNGVMDDGQPAYSIIPSPNPFFFSISPKGGLQAGDIEAQRWNDHTYTDEELLKVGAIAASTTENDPDAGFFFLCRAITASPVKFFSFIEDEWTSLGTADFLDAWFPIFWENGLVPEIPVDIYYNKTQPGTYLLYNPYGIAGDKNNPYSEANINISTKPGYIIFDMNDFECVRFKPLVESCVLDMRASEADPETPWPFYCFNAEGYYYYVEAATIEDIIVVFEEDGRDVSYFDQRSNMVNIYNAVFGMADSFATPTYWNNADGEGYIVMPANWADGVDSVLGEDLNAPAVYYNLQGQRVANPEKGQLVIVRQGSKASKIIVR